MGEIIAALIKQKIAGKLIGLLASKTQWGVTTVAGSALWGALPGAIEGDPEAVGQVVMTGLGWLGAMYGRLKARWS